MIQSLFCADFTANLSALSGVFVLFIPPSIAQVLGWHLLRIKQRKFYAERIKLGKPSHSLALGQFFAAPRAMRNEKAAIVGAREHIFIKSSDIKNALFLRRIRKIHVLIHHVTAKHTFLLPYPVFYIIARCGKGVNKMTTNMCACLDKGSCSMV